MSEVVYVSKSRIERKQGPFRVAYLPGESQLVIYSGCVVGQPSLIRLWKSCPSSARNPEALPQPSEGWLVQTAALF
jgi:hypothetical protein